ncbi:MAG: hypothetical protein VKJ09_13810 [Leptolyngbya sp.]|nr:hypothetical protein [Leptolyngbya sp.]
MAGQPDVPAVVRLDAPLPLALAGVGVAYVGERGDVEENHQT